MACDMDFLILNLSLDHSHGIKVNFICQGQISWSHFSRNSCLGGISVSQTHLVSVFGHMITWYTGHRMLI